MGSQRIIIYVYKHISNSKGIGGDVAARSAASQEVKSVGEFNRLDIPGIYTLATVIVDYMGQRVQCQSIIPGILQSNEASQLIYGSVDNGGMTCSLPPTLSIYDLICVIVL